MDFHVWHRYFTLIRRHIIPPLLCQHDSHELSLMAGKNDEPVLKCWFCGTTTLPGSKMYANIEAVVKEHYV